MNAVCTVNTVHATLQPFRAALSNLYVPARNEARERIMLERYTDKARRVVFFARFEASQYGSQYIETEHLLLGVIREDPRLANRFLPTGASETIRQRVDSLKPRRTTFSTSIDIPLSKEG